MPILPPEPCQSPSSLFADDSHRLNGQRQWWVLQTRPRAEKQLARRLWKNDVPFFLPLYERQRRIQRRLVRSQLPLFQGYLFLLANDDERAWTCRTNLVANCLQVTDQEELDRALWQIHQLIEAKQRLVPEPVLEAGVAVEITGGPLAGQRGTVVRKGTQLRLVIAVNFLQQGASVEVSADFVEPV